MGVSKQQLERVDRVCACGCNQTFSPFPVYDKGKGKGLRYPEYKRGHHPNNRTADRKCWNKGLTKEVCPTLSRMGFQPGHVPYNDWRHVNKQLSEDPVLRERWLEAKRTQVPWNKNLTKDQYPNGIASGADHGNWCGGDGGVRDTAEYKAFVRRMLKRDNWTCQECGDHNYKGRGKRVKLHVHHKVAVSEDPSRALDPTNVETLCEDCHKKTDNFGTKLIHKRRALRGA
jgi:hypothetical protein